MQFEAGIERLAHPSLENRGTLGRIGAVLLAVGLFIGSTMTVASTGLFVGTWMVIVGLGTGIAMATAMAVPPAWVMASAVACAASSDRSAMTTLPPSRA